MSCLSHLYAFDQHCHQKVPNKWMWIRLIKPTENHQKNSTLFRTASVLMSVIVYGVKRVYSCLKFRRLQKSDIILLSHVAYFDKATKQEFPVLRLLQTTNSKPTHLILVFLPIDKRHWHTLTKRKLNLAIQFWNCIVFFARYELKCDS